MKFRALEKGFVGYRVYPGDEFDADEGFKASWAEPVEAASPALPADPEVSDSASGDVGDEVEPEKPDKPSTRKKTVPSKKG